MPFTAVHPAAVLPIVRYGLPGSALVIGSITPDLPMILPVPTVVHFAHTPSGLVTVDLVMGMIAFVLWQVLFGPAVLALAPRALSGRVPAGLPKGLAFHRATGVRIALVLAGVLIGAATHIVWDAFTHDWMWGPELLPWLASRHGSMMGWQWIQHISDFAGGAIVVAWVAVWWRGTPRRTEDEALPRRIRVLAWLAVLVPATAGFLYGLLTASWFVAFSRGAGLGAVCLVAVSVTWWVRTRR
ncbi:DUF4184 family protein [Actinoplanes sp. NPDC026623]|uniref:DUF4184 family protein n=1 Tax=Actinoplanes sp. NPDC026623 TaxID=3155610 RepID=UPI003411C5DE